ncbi:MAG: type II toxin-antitoxin system RatA family toxin [Pseudomonadota bacterium]
MAIHRETLTVAHTPAHLFELVADVDAYPEFIPWIKAIRISRRGETNGVRACRAEAVVGFKGFRERFSTDVAADPAERVVTADLVSGPFRRLANRWRFRARSDGQTDVEFFLDYEFRSIVLQALSRANLAMATERLIDAYIAEADRRHPRITLSASAPE